MNYEMLLYAIFIMVSGIALSGINFEKIIKKNKIIEVRILIVILSLISGYLLTNFVIDFLKL